MCMPDLMHRLNADQIGSPSDPNQEDLRAPMGRWAYCLFMDLVVCYCLFMDLIVCLLLVLNRTNTNSA